jgi:hypothetical protein
VIISKVYPDTFKLFFLLPRFSFMGMACWLPSLFCWLYSCIAPGHFCWLPHYCFGFYWFILMLHSNRIAANRI